MPKGPSTSTSPYLVASEPNVTITSIATVGDVIGTKADGITPYRFVGIPDGMGAFDNNDGTITVLINHELRPDRGIVREHGAIGSFVSQLTIDKTTLAVTAAEDAIKSVQLWDDATEAFVTTTYAIGRLCSADLAPVSAYYWVDTQGTVDASDDVAYGTQDRIFMAGEEIGSEGKQFGIAVTGAEAGVAYDLAYMGLYSWENSLTSPFAQKKTVNISTDDSGGGEVYVYIGEKQTTGNAVEKAGLVGGSLYGIKASGLDGAANTETDALAASGTFSLVKLGADEDGDLLPDGDVSKMTGVQLEAQSGALGVTSFLRPEDGHFDPTNPNVFYFVTTASIVGQSRLYKMTFTDITNPEAGGTIESILDSNQLTVTGDIGPRMMDNMVVTDEGKIIIQEDPGNAVHLARVFEYDPVADTLVELARHDPALFLATSPTYFGTQDEEASGVIDVTSLLGVTGGKAYLYSDQIHKASADAELVEEGQLGLIVVSDVVNGGNGSDTLNGNAFANTLLGANGNDTMNGGSGNDQLDGGRGNDVINGGVGSDLIEGGLNNDTLTGGAGADVFDFTRVVFKAGGNGVGTGRDVITDFEDGVDKLLFSAGDTIKGQRIGDWDVDGSADDVRFTLSSGAQIVLLNMTLIEASDYSYDGLIMS
jgi:Ca2+-binding RTX toxin-like protein